MMMFFSSKDLLPQPKYKVLWLDELNHELKDELIEKEAEKTNVTSRWALLLALITYIIYFG